MDSFTALVDELFGDAVDPRELSDLISKQNDASEAHIPANLARRRKREAQIGLASNILGLTAGVAATAAAVKNPALRRTIPKTYKGGPITGRAAGLLKTEEGRARLYRVGAGGALGLQLANTGGDVVANRVLGREAKKKVAKSLAEVIAAQRMGRITAEQAVAIVEKALGEKGDAKQIFAAVDAIAPAIPGQKAQMANAGIQQGKKGVRLARKLKPRGKVLAMAKRPKAVPIEKSKDVVWSGTISKRDDEKRQVFGFCTVTHVNGAPVVDLQNDYIPLDEIEKSAYTYVLESRKGGDQHSRDGENPLHTSDLIESFVITPEKLEKMGLEPNALPHGWWVGFKVNDEQQWERVKKNERTGFSIHGSGKRVERDLP